MPNATEKANRATAAASSFPWGELLPARYAAVVVAACDAAGVDTDTALQTVGLTRAQLAGPGALVPASISYRLFALASESDPTFPVHAGASLPWGDAGLIDYVNGSRATLGAVIASMIRFARVVTRLRYVLEDERHGAFLRVINSPPPGPVARMVSEFNLSLLFGRLRDITGREVGIEVRFTHGAPGWLAALRERFRCKVTFEAPASGILFTHASLAYPSRRADRRLEAIVERYALDVLEENPEDETLAGSVAAGIRAALPEGAPTMRRIARTLATSERTLRRRLAAEGLTFDRLRDSELERLARELLRSRSSSIEEVAYLLGFSHARAFQRAFKRWTGLTPTAFRTRCDESAQDRVTG